MAFRIEITRRAEADTEAAYLWYFEENPKVAGRWFRGLQKVFSSLEELPRRGPVVPEGEDLGREIRQLLYGSGRHMYRIFFEVCDDTVYILRVHHTSRSALDPADFS